MSDQGAIETATTDGAKGGDGARLEAGSRVGRYEVVDFIGGGGMGWVYRAKDTELEREVAIKVVQPTAAGPRGRERLLAEARAMAKLRHRNVVPVFDVGEHAGGVYVAMELVAGGTLHDWLHAEARPWRAVLARFLDAGRGLVAAHAAGIVHRDFKPRNVLLGAGGDVMVADFGIASTGAVDDDGGTSGELSTITGTPAYMAPEQAAGQAVDARADQYSFCVSLWEGLHGERPQDAETRTQGALLARVHDTPKARRKVPGWLASAVARGFSPTPERRWPTLSVLIAHCERGLGRRRRWLLAGGGVALVATAATVAVWRSRPAAGPTCDVPQDRIDAVWTAARGQQLRAKMVALDPETGSARADRAIGAFDRVASQWSDAVVKACRDTRIDRTQSEGLLTKRMDCLDQALTKLSTSIGAVEGAADARDLNARLRVLDGLPFVEMCSEVAQLAGYPALPDDPNKLREYRSLSTELQELNVEYLIGNLAEHARRTPAAVDRGRKLGDPRLLARLIDQLALAKQAAGSYDEMVTLTKEAIALASEAHDDRIVADMWLTLVSTVAERMKQPAEAEKLLLSAEAAVSRSDSTYHRQMLSLTRAALQSAKGDLEGALVTLDDSVAQLEKAGARSAGAEFWILLSRATGRRALILHRLGRPREAIAGFEDTIAQITAAYGPEHASLASYFGNLSQSYLKIGDREAGVSAMKRALTISEKDLGPTPRLATMYWGLGETLIMAQQFDEALPYTARAAEMGRSTLKADDGRLADILGSHGVALVETGSLDTGLAVIDESLAIYTKGKPSLNAGLTEFSRAEALARARRWTDAVASYERAGQLLETVAGARSPEVLEARLGAAVVWARQEQWARSLALTERLLRDPFDKADAGLARAHFWHGLAQVQLKRGGAAARAEVESAAATLRADAGTSKAVLADLETGLAAIHPAAR